MDPLIPPRPDPGLPPAPAGHQPLISATPDTLPLGQLVRPVAIPVTRSLDHHLLHHLLVMDLDQIAEHPEQLEATYLSFRGTLRRSVFDLLGTPDPDIDPVGYWASRWWRHGITLNLALIRHAEDMGRAYPWRHGRTAGPLFSPSRA
jgi:hypothetical protein